MKFMKLGTRPDTFFTSESTRSVSSDIATDIKIKISDTIFLLHKFPLLSKCARLQKLCSGDDPIELPDIPGGIECFEICAKFCYGISITISALHFVSVYCAATYLQMHDNIEKGNLVAKLDSFLKSCILRRWKDAIVTLRSTTKHFALCEELGITSHCVDAIAFHILTRVEWASDVSELWIDHYWRIMLAVRSAGTVSSRVIGHAVEVYACRWLPPDLSKSGKKLRVILEKIIRLLPLEKGSCSCSFLINLLRACTILDASQSSRTELVRRVGIQLEEACVSDLVNLHDVDIVLTILEEFMIQVQSPDTSPPRGRLEFERRRSRSAENFDEFERRLSCSSTHSSKLRVAKLIDSYLVEIAKDENLPIEKFIAVSESVPDFARTDHDDLYRAIDTYLSVHPDLEKSSRKKICRVLNCKKLSLEVCAHAAQNEKLPLRVLVQVLFFEQAHAAVDKEAVVDATEDDWSMSGLKCHDSKLVTLRMKLEEDDDDVDEEFISRDGFMRSSSSRFKALCAIPNKPKRMLSKLWSLNRSVR